MLFLYPVLEFSLCRSLIYARLIQVFLAVKDTNVFCNENRFIHARGLFQGNVRLTQRKELRSRTELGLFGPGARFSKVPKTFRARKAIRKTLSHIFCKAGLFMCCKGKTTYLQSFLPRDAFVLKIQIENNAILQMIY